MKSIDSKLKNFRDALEIWLKIVRFGRFKGGALEKSNYKQNINLQKFQTFKFTERNTSRLATVSYLRYKIFFFI